jgi:hypothetical protein
MANTLLIKRSGTAATVPETLSYGELALNYADGYLFYKNSAGAIVSLTAQSGLNAKLDGLTFNGATTVFNLAVGAVALTPNSASSLLISLNGVIQEPGVAYTVSGSQITFAAAPASNATFFGVHLTSGAGGGGTGAGGDAVTATASQITGDQNNYALPSNTDIVRLSSDATRTLTGFEADTGAVVTLYNVGSFDIRVAHQSSSSTAANRVISATGSDVMLAPNDNLTLVYDNTSSRWRTSGVVKVSTPNQAAVYEFTRSTAPADATGNLGAYTWSLPANAKVVEFLLIGGGGGGGSGRRGAAGSARFGGGGGGGGNATVVNVQATTITTALTISVGSGGAGAAAITTNDTDGGNATTGTASFIRYNAVPGSTPIVAATNGFGGSGGTAAAGSGGGAVSNSADTFRALGGGSSSVTAAAGNGGVPLGFAGVAGAAGGGISTANVVQSAGVVSPGGPFVAAMSNVLVGSAYATRAGGAASTTAAAGSGESGYPYGGGGSGGGASANGFNSGAGGNGADGYVRITVWF